MQYVNGMQCYERPGGGARGGQGRVEASQPQLTGCLGRGGESRVCGGWKESRTTCSRAQISPCEQWELGNEKVLRRGG